MALRTEGKTYEQIGAELGVNKQAAHRLVMVALDDIKARTNEDAERVRELELRRLDDMTQGLWPRRADPRVTDTLLRIMDRRAKLLGLDAPERHEVMANAALDASIMAELSAFRAAGAARVVSVEALPEPQRTSLALDAGDAPALVAAAGSTDGGAGKPG